MSKINPLYKYGDIKYFYKLHKQRQIQMWNAYLSYPAFYNRLKIWMSLKEAIYTPSNTRKIRHNVVWNKLRMLRVRFISLFK